MINLPVGAGFRSLRKPETGLEDSGLMDGERVADRSVASPRRRRGKWFLGALLLAIVTICWLWPRSIRIPLSDGNTLEIAAITTGVTHSHPVPVMWRSVRNQFIAKSPYRPVQTYTTPEPMTVLWLDDPMLFGLYRIELIDCRGHRLTMVRGKISNDGCLWAYPAIETDQMLQVEVRSEKGKLLGRREVPFRR